VEVSGPVVKREGFWADLINALFFRPVWREKRREVWTSERLQEWIDANVTDEGFTLPPNLRVEFGPGVVIPWSDKPRVCDMNGALCVYVGPRPPDSPFYMFTTGPPVQMGGVG
jgi:hypothetical protein